MKLTVNKCKGFRSFNIVVETEEEAIALYHLTNNPISISMVKYCKGKSISSTELAEVKDKLWQLIFDEFNEQKIDTEEF